MDRYNWQQWSDRISTILIIIVLSLFALLLFTQFGLQFSIIREWVTGVDRLEGIPFVEASFFCICLRNVV